MSGAATLHEAEAIIDDETLAEEKLLEELENEEIPAEIREARLAELKRQTIEYSHLRDKNHGQYTEMEEEKGFLDLTTSSERCVVHFFHVDFRRCAIMDTHLKKLAEKYFETKFAKINVEKAKFFVKKLKVQVLPAVFCFKDGIVVDKITGFDEIGNSDSFPTHNLERRFAKSGVIDAKDIDDDDEEEDQKKTIFGFKGSQKKEDTDSDDDW